MKSSMAARVWACAPVTGLPRVVALHRANDTGRPRGLRHQPQGELVLARNAAASSAERCGISICGK